MKSDSTKLEMLQKKNLQLEETIKELKAQLKKVIIFFLPITLYSIFIRLSIVDENIVNNDVSHF